MSLFILSIGPKLCVINVVFAAVVVMIVGVIINVVDDVFSLSSLVGGRFSLTTPTTVTTIARL